jgi:hypothetical protein
MDKLPFPLAMRFTVRAYDGRNCDVIGLTGFVNSVAATSSPSNGVATRTHVPIL